MKNIQGIVILVVVIIALIAGGFLLSNPQSTRSTSESASTQAGESADPDLLYNDFAPVVGNKNPNVKLVVFSDFLCPYCKQAHDVINQVLIKNPEISMQYRNLIVHEDSRILAQAAEAANIQGKFEEMNDALFSKTPDTNEESVINLAKELGLDIVKFKSDLTSETVKNRIEQDEKDAVALKLQGTPSVYIGNQSVDNFNQLEELVKTSLSK